MSSLPGTTLESFLMWDLRLIVDGDDSANPSSQIAEALGHVPRRPELTAAQFAPIVALYEPLRARIEGRLNDFPGDEYASWRDYAGYNFDFIPDELNTAAAKLLASIPPPPPASSVS